MTEWDPGTYLQFADERSRPFADLVARVGAKHPQRVIDLGCGPGQLTAGLADRWPDAAVEGLDASPHMIARAAEHDRPNLRFTEGTVQDWLAARSGADGRPSEAYDVIVSNATLQWVPGHRELLPRLVDALAAGGWLAFAVPGNFGEPSHQLLRELAAEEPYAPHTAHLGYPASSSAADYLGVLLTAGCTVDAWETTYLHVLSGPDPVFRWIAGTGARPVLQALPEANRAAFEEEYRRRLQTAYPPTSGFGDQARTVLPFRRIFCVARAPQG